MFDYSKYYGMRVFMYLRQSTKEEGGKQEQSLPDQERDCLLVAERWGLEVVEIIKEDESAWRPHKREKFKKLLKELSYKSPERRRADGILSWHPNRLSRNALEAGMIVQMLDDEQIKNLFFYGYTFHNDTSGKEHLTIEFARSKSSSDGTSEATSRGIRSREQQGAMVSNSKFGYTHRREDKNPKKCSLFPIPDDEKFPIIKRVFELGMKGFSSAQIVESLNSEFPRASGGYLSSWVDKRLRDSFYCGTWVIKKGQKDERRVELSEITLPDGTRFTPVISKLDFDTLQQMRSARANGTIRRKRANPLPNLVSCQTCGGQMYACYRKIKVAGGLKEDRLGYECQTKRDGVRCTQGRVQGDLVLSLIGDFLKDVSVNLNKATYEKYLLTVNLLSKSVASTKKSQKAKLQASLRNCITQRQELIQTRAALIRKDALDKASEEYYDTEIENVSGNIEGLQEQIQEMNIAKEVQFRSFYQFLELKENLALYWKNADTEKKGELSKILFLNLEVNGKELANLSVKKPFSSKGKGVEFRNGVAQGGGLEPYVKSLWDWFSKRENRHLVEDVLRIHRIVDADTEATFPIVKDMEQLSGTQ